MGFFFRHGGCSGAAMRFQSLFFLVLGLPLWSACGSTTVETPSSELLPACQRLVAKRTEYAKRCFGYSDNDGVQKAYVDSCVGIASAAGSTLTLSDIDACSAALASPECQSGPGYPSCTAYGSNVLYPGHDKKGTLAAGEGCAAQLQCESGYCSSSGQSCGVCENALKLGEACGPSPDHCIEGWCIEGTCQLTGKKPGEMCIDYGGGDCQEIAFCKPIASTGIDGICTLRGQSGAACDDDSACVLGLYCNAGTCAEPGAPGTICNASQRCMDGVCTGGVCQAYAWGLDVGEDCSVGYCRSDLQCDEGHHCVAFPFAAAGQPCAVPGTPDTYCAPGLYCHREGCVNGDCPSPGDCRKMPEAGEHCTPFAGCADTASCVGFDGSDPNKGTCVHLGIEKEPCPCEEGLTCAGDTCLPFGQSACP